MCQRRFLQRVRIGSATVGCWRRLPLQGLGYSLVAASRSQVSRGGMPSLQACSPMTSAGRTGTSTIRSGQPSAAAESKWPCSCRLWVAVGWPGSMRTSRSRSLWSPGAAPRWSRAGPASSCGRPGTRTGFALSSSGRHRARAGGLRRLWPCRGNFGQFYWPVACRDSLSSSAATPGANFPRFVAPGIPPSGLCRPCRYV